MSWLTEALSQMELESEEEDYLLSRGAKEDRCRSCVTWSEVEASFPQDFEERYGPRGQYLLGCLITPYEDANGDFLGFEARRFDTTKKWVSDYRITPRAKWCPVGIGMAQAAAKLQQRTDLWLVEGQFDLYALDWFLPNHVASFATVRAGISYHHAMWIRRFVKGTVVFCYDNDGTGREAAVKGIRWLNSLGVQCNTATYGGGKDPGEIWDSGGAEAVLKAFGAQS